MPLRRESPDDWRLQKSMMGCGTIDPTPRSLSCPVKWLTQYLGQQLIKKACNEKLTGTRRLNAQGTATSLVLIGREGEGEGIWDLCTFMPYLTNDLVSLRPHPSSFRHPLPV
jgi:hypothetical protein